MQEKLNFIIFYDNLSLVSRRNIWNKLPWIFVSCKRELNNYQMYSTWWGLRYRGTPAHEPSNTNEAVLVGRPEETLISHNLHSRVTLELNK